MTSDVPPSTRPDPEVGPSTPEDQASDARIGLSEAEREAEAAGSAADAVAPAADASAVETAEAAEPAEASEGSAAGETSAYDAEASHADAEGSEGHHAAEIATSEPYAAATASETDASEDPDAAETSHDETDASEDPYAAEASHDETDASEDPYAAETAASEGDDDPYEAETDGDELDSEASGDYALGDDDRPRGRRRPLSKEEVIALFHAKAVLLEVDDSAEGEAAEDGEPSDVEPDHVHDRERPLSEAEAAVEAEAALFHTDAAEAEAEADAALFPPDAAQPQPDAESSDPETLLFEAESALFRAEVALAEDEAALVDAAWEARTRAVCRYSGFAVGAALLDVHGQQFTGANVENASYNLGLCAERVALYHALTHGAGRFVAVAIVTEAPTPTSPCGACRQALWEFAPHAEILLVTRNGHQRLTMRDLLPFAFDHESLRAAAAAADDPAR